LLQERALEGVILGANDFRQREIFGSTSFRSEVAETSCYQKIEFIFSPSRTIHEGSWESTGYIDEMYSILDDLFHEQPLPQEYRQYLGMSLFDSLTAEQTSAIAHALHRWLRGAPEV
jgi:hypothetical protein